MNEHRKSSWIRKVANAATVLTIGSFLVACDGDTSCTTSSDCFQGEVCESGTCESPAADDAGPGATDADEAENNDGDGKDGGGDTPDSTDTTEADHGGADDDSGVEPDGDTAPTAACIVDPFGNTCDDDEYEPNELPNTSVPLLFDNQSWCTGEDLLATQTSAPLRLCAGNAADVFRLMIDNRTPSNCLTQQFTWKTEVRFQTACTPELVRVEPYYSNPAQEDRCADDENFRCSWSPDGQTFTIEEVRQPDQLMDIKVLVEPVDGRDDLQVEYDVVMTIIR